MPTNVGKIPAAKIRPLNLGADLLDEAPASWASFSGADCHVAAYVPITRAKEGPPGKKASGFKVFAELQTISISSHRGFTQVRCMGESWIRETARGTRTYGGTMVFSVLDRDVFTDLYDEWEMESRTEFPTFVDMLPPFTITIQAVNEQGRVASMALYDVTILSNGMTLSIDDILTETTYSFVAQWVTPFMDLNASELIRKVLKSNTTATVPTLSSMIGIPGVR
jgi:hypothetical protein